MMKKTLILLIGTNPLPNYLTAMNYLTDTDNYTDEIICIFSDTHQNQSSTEQYAENLIEVLRDELNKEIKYIKISLKNISSRESIEKILAENYTNKLFNRKIHLNHTGGTKTMAVHIYNYFYKNFEEIEFSYLDARDNKMHWHTKDKDETPLNSISNKFSITCKNLLKLHNYRFYDKFDENNLNFIPKRNSFEEFEAILKSTEYDYNKLLDIKKELFNYDVNYFRFSLKIDTFQKYKQYYNTLDFINKINLHKEAIRNLSYLSINQEDFNKLDKLTFQKTIYPSIDYFQNDKFFEHLCFIALKKSIEEYNEINDTKIIEYGTSIECIKLLINNKEVVKNFELDLYFIKGIQFFGISCTTSVVRSTIKSKGFEIIHRTKQIGGEEARAIMIYRKRDQYANEEDNPKHLQLELEQDTGSSQNRFYMKPFIDIEKMKQDFTKIINEN